MTLLETIQHDLLSNITVTEMLADGDVCEWVADYVEDLMTDNDLDIDDNYELFNTGCVMVYAHFGAEELESNTTEWDEFWNNKQQEEVAM